MFKFLETAVDVLESGADVLEKTYAECKEKFVELREEVFSESSSTSSDGDDTGKQVSGNTNKLKDDHSKNLTKFLETAVDVLESGEEKCSDFLEETYTECKEKFVEFCEEVFSDSSSTSSDDDDTGKQVSGNTNKLKDDHSKNMTDGEHQVSISQGASIPPQSNSVSPINTTEKLKDVKVSKETGSGSLKSSGTFLGVLKNERRLKRFSHEELKEVTSGFAKGVGSGGYGKVYQGTFLDGTKVAVKVLGKDHLIEETFEAEVSTVFKTSHRYLIKCYGYCSDPTMKAIVYEYMKNRSLDTVLYGNPHKLEWKKFYKISIQIAKGLAYLHDGCEHQIIHHDLKPANVLIDGNFSPKISDYGLARLMNRNLSHFAWTKFRGTAGYVAPEMALRSSEITYKCDVYSFGMMLFEILGMRRNGGSSDWFPERVWLKFDKGELSEILDECDIHKKDDRANAEQLSMVALWCVQFTAQARPSMSTVVKMLEGLIPVIKPPNPFYPTTEFLYSEASSSSSIDKSMQEKGKQKTAELASPSYRVKQTPRSNASNRWEWREQPDMASQNSESGQAGKSKPGENMNKISIMYQCRIL